VLDAHAATQVADARSLHGALLEIDAVTSNSKRVRARIGGVLVAVAAIAKGYF